VDDFSWITFAVSESQIVLRLLRDVTRAPVSAILLDLSFDHASLSPSELQQLKFSLLQIPELALAPNFLRHVHATLTFYGLLSGPSSPLLPRDEIFVADHVAGFAGLTVSTYRNHLPPSASLEDHLAVPFDFFSPLFEIAETSTVAKEIAWEVLAAEPVPCFLHAPGSVCRLIHEDVIAGLPYDIGKGRILDVSSALMAFLKRSVVEGAVVGAFGETGSPRGHARKVLSDAVGRYGEQVAPVSARFLECLANGALMDLQLQKIYAVRGNGLVEAETMGASIVRGATSLDEIQNRYDNLWDSGNFYGTLASAMPTTPSEAPTALQSESWRRLAQALVEKQPGHILLNPRGLLRFAGIQTIHTCLTSGWKDVEVNPTLGLDLVKLVMERAEVAEGDEGRTLREITRCGLSVWIGNIHKKYVLKSLPKEEANDLLQGAKPVVELLQKDSSATIKTAALGLFWKID